MHWNKIFWCSFVLAEALLLMVLATGFSVSFLSAAAIVLVFGIVKLVEDSQSCSSLKRTSKVRRSLLNKLKKESN